MKKVVIIYLGVLLFCNHLFSQNGWIKQLTTITNECYAVEFTDQMNGWISCESGTLLYTDVGGDNWVLKTVPSGAALYDLHLFSSETLVVVGEGGKIYKTLDEGSTWVEQTSGVSSDLFAVYFIDSNIGWACGANGTILYTIDGGINWIKQFEQTDQWLYDICFKDQSQGWAVGWGGHYMHTEDGGLNWNTSDLDTDDNLNCICFSDDMHGWIGDGNMIMYTHDGGISWNKQHETTWFYSYNGLSFPDNQTGWAVSNGGYIQKTTDGGVTWENQFQVPLAYKLNDVFFIDNNIGWAVGGNGIVYHTTNGGGSSSVNNENALDRVHIYPLPFDDKLTIEIRDNLTNYNITGLYSVQGENMIADAQINHNSKVNNKITISSGDFNRGIYFLSMNINGKPAVFKIVKL